MLDGGVGRLAVALTKNQATLTTRTVYIPACLGRTVRYFVRPGAQCGGEKAIPAKQHQHGDVKYIRRRLYGGTVLRHVNVRLFIPEKPISCCG